MSVLIDDDGFHGELADTLRSRPARSPNELAGVIALTAAHHLGNAVEAELRRRDQLITDLAARLDRLERRR